VPSSHIVCSLRNSTIFHL